MLTIYNAKNIGEKKYLKDVQISFEYYKEEIKQMPELEEVSKAIDSVIEIRGAYIKTMLGETSIDNLSSGCKALLLAILLGEQDVIVSFLECGKNVISYALQKNYNISIYCAELMQVTKEASKIPFMYSGKTMTIKEYHLLA